MPGGMIFLERSEAATLRHKGKLHFPPRNFRHFPALTAACRAANWRAD